MRLLFDTHALLWYLTGNDRLPKRWRTFGDANEARREEVNAEEKFFSYASYWEIAIKISLGKLKLTRPLHTLAAEITARNFKWVLLQHSHCHEVAGLPLHHRDPFDRLLVAQARVEGLKILSIDPQLRAYDAECVW